MARSGIIYGESGTFKTTAIGHMARHFAETTGKATLLFSSDGGGWNAVDEEVQAGLIRPYHCDSATIPLPIVRKVSQGYWPENPEEADVSLVNFRPVDWNEVGAIAVEGVTSIGTMLMRHYADKNIKSGEEATSRFSMPIRVNGEIVQEAFGQNSKGHYGGVQNQLYSMMMNFISLPVEYVLFTGHEKKYAEDGELQCGINAPGKAITPLIPSWVGDCIHADKYKQELEVKVPDPSARDGFSIEKIIRVRCRYFFMPHVDAATGAIFNAKPRVTHSKALELERVFPGGFFVPTPEHGFDDYLRAVDRLAQDAAQADSLKDWRSRMDAKLGRRQVAATSAPVAAPATQK